MRLVRSTIHLIRSDMPPPFLAARWEDLVLLNYLCPAQVLAPLVPRGTVLDTWNGETMVSLVGFLFRDTRVVGFRVPFHRTFEEVNLRLYVRRTTTSGEIRRGVVFVRELVPRHAIAALARWMYNEPYLSVPMEHRLSLSDADGGTVNYSWSYRGGPFAIGAEVSGSARLPAPASEAAFITEHYWGYTRQRNGDTLEYHVAHPPWRVWETASARFSGAGRALYGPAFGEVLSTAPHSAFVSTGSEVTVHRGLRVATDSLPR